MLDSVKNSRISEFHKYENTRSFTFKIAKFLFAKLQKKYYAMSD